MSGQVPARRGGAVLDDDSGRREPLAQGVCARPVLDGAGGGALVEQGAHEAVQGGGGGAAAPARPGADKI